MQALGVSKKLKELKIEHPTKGQDMTVALLPVQEMDAAFLLLALSTAVLAWTPGPALRSPARSASARHAWRGHHPISRTLRSGGVQASMAG